MDCWRELRMLFGPFNPLCKIEIFTFLVNKYVPSSLLRQHEKENSQLQFLWDLLILDFHLDHTEWEKYFSFSIAWLWMCVNIWNFSLATKFLYMLLMMIFSMHPIFTKSITGNFLIDEIRDSFAWTFWEQWPRKKGKLKT